MSASIDEIPASIDEGLAIEVDTNDAVSETKKGDPKPLPTPPTAEDVKSLMAQFTDTRKEIDGIFANAQIEARVALRNMQKSVGEQLLFMSKPLYKNGIAALDGIQKQHNGKCNSQAIAVLRGIERNGAVKKKKKSSGTHKNAEFNWSKEICDILGLDETSGYSHPFMASHYSKWAKERGGYKACNTNPEVVALRALLKLPADTNMSPFSLQHYLKEGGHSRGLVKKADAVEASD